MNLTDQVQDTVTHESQKRDNLVATVRTIDRLREAGLIGFSARSASVTFIR
jgi:hypothetical protein